MCNTISVVRGTDLLKLLLTGSCHNQHVREKDILKPSNASNISACLLIFTHIITRNINNIQRN